TNMPKLSLQSKEMWAFIFNIIKFKLSKSSYPEVLPSETPTATQVDGADLASPMSPRTSKSRMSMKLRRSSGSANKS
uniref:Uncharacterized protein n=1 Tax=Myotis lucifugus TaxID=59463 RepID=G1Q5E7_MYOLU